MKKEKWIAVIFMVVLVAVLGLTLAACGGGTGGDDNNGGDNNGGDSGKTVISGITFSDAEYTYDGTEKEVLISGNLPADASVSYSGNKQTEAGIYTVTATISGAKYITLQQMAKLTINKATISGITLSNATYQHDGTEKEIVISGTLPQGTSVSYVNNKKTDAGTYAVTATISGANYNTLVLNATLTINSAVEPGKTDITGITFSGATYTYDGEPKSILISGELPQGASVSYTDNQKINAGTYSAKAVISGDAYNTLTLNATLTINNADITGITFPNKTYVYDGSAKIILILGTLPQGTSVSYTNNQKTDAGNYTATAVVSGTNYNTLNLTASLRIINVANFASDFIMSMLVTPNLWQFLPESFALENKAYEGLSVIDFNNSYVQTSTLPKNGIGKQMNVLYSYLLELEPFVDKLNIFYTTAEVAIDFYQYFINENPDSYSSYEKTTDNFDFKIELTTEKDTLLVKYATVSIELSVDKTTGILYGRIQLSNGNILKYEIGEDSLKFAIELLGVSLSCLEFEKDGDVVNGKLYEFLGTEGASLKTSAVINITDDYTTIMSNKRENDEVVIIGAEEVYDNESGQLVAWRIKTGNSILNYDTYWFNLFDITGINSVKKADTSNGMNPDTIYVNGNANPFEAKKVGGINPTTALSRRFDIEMVTTYFIVYDSATEKYGKIEMEIPMLFVQAAYLTTYKSEIYDTNKNNGIAANVANTMTASELGVVTNKYDELIDGYVTLKETMLYADIVEYLGEENEYFSE